MSMDIERLKVDREYWDSVAPDWARFYYPVSSFFISHSLGIANAIPRPEPRQVEWDGEDWQILCDYTLCGSFPVDLKAGDKIKVHGVVDVGFGEVLLISDPKVAGTGTIVKSQVAPIRTKEQREREELSDDLMGILPFCEYTDSQIREMAQILYTQGYRKPEKDQ